jgi:alpha-L-fucosidase
MLDSQELAILEEVTKWMAVNGEAIYGTRPWKTYGDGPAITAAIQARSSVSDHHQAGAFNESGRKLLTASDILFTQKGGRVYAFAMGRPEDKVNIPVLAQDGEHSVGKIWNVEMLGANGKLTWRQDSGGLTIKTPMALPSEHAIVFKIAGA